jgi:hypothetical protein
VKIQVLGGRHVIGHAGAADMKIRDIITEEIKQIEKDHESSLMNASTFPKMNSSTGSAYLNYRFGIALAGAPDFPMASEPWIGGDPLLTTYTEAEMAIINYASKQVGGGKPVKWSNGRSNEAPGVGKDSPVAKKKTNKYGV